MNTTELRERLERLTKRATKTGRAIERTKQEIADAKAAAQEQEQEQAQNTILVAGIRFARLNLGTTLDRPNGELYDFDAAQKACPEGWTLPTKEQWRQLYDRTTHKWATQNGATGMLFIDKETGNELFLPAAGYRNCNTGVLTNQGRYGWYWSSSVFDANYGWHLYFNSSGGIDPEYSNARGYGFSVRCVKTNNE